MKRVDLDARRIARREEPRRSILDATEELLVADGYEGFSMRRLVGRCGFTAPTIYHYFGDKRGLIDALLEERFGRLLRQLRRVPRGRDPAEYLRALAHAFVRFGLRNPTHYRLLMTPRPEGSPPPRSAEAARAVFDAPMLELKNQGRLRTDDLECAMQSIWSLLHGQISLRIVRPDFGWSSSLFDVSFGAVLEGLVAPSQARRATRSGSAGDRR